MGKLLLKSGYKCPEIIPKISQIRPEIPEISVLALPEISVIYEILSEIA